MTLARPPDWPQSVPPPLVAAQTDDVRQYLTATHEEVAVVVRCWKCGCAVGDVMDLTVEDGEGRHFYMLIGSVYRGTIRSSDRRLEAAKFRHALGTAAGSSSKKRPNVPLDDQYLACIEARSAGCLPALLPAWCDSEKALNVDRRAAAMALAKWRRKSPEKPLSVAAYPPRSPR